MADFVLTGATVHVGGYDLTSDLNKVTVATTVDEVDATTFGSAGWKERKAGLRSVDVSHDGYVSYADPDSTLWADLGVQRVFTATPTGADGATAYFLNATRFGYTPLDAQVGEMAKFTGMAAASDGVGMVRGGLLLPKGTRSGSTNGTGAQLGAASATQKLYTAIHVFSAGTTCTVIVESASGSGFSSASTRSSTVVTAAGGTWVAPVSGAIADTWWRVRLASVTGSFSLAVAVGIQ